jgi:hypothetical protein
MYVYTCVCMWVGGFLMLRVQFESENYMDMNFYFGGFECVYGFLMLMCAASVRAICINVCV